MTDRTSSKTFHRPAPAGLKSRRDSSLHPALVRLAHLLARQSVAEHFRALADDLCPNASAGDDPEREKESHT